MVSLWLMKTIHCFQKEEIILLLDIKQICLKIGKVGYLTTSVNRPSIDRKAMANVIDFDFKPSFASRLYGWAGEIDIKEKGVQKKGLWF